MARAHAANECAQSDSIKGLAQSIAKPAYTRLLTAEPTLRRAVPTLIIAFLITICLGAFVQVLDQSRQKRAAAERDLICAFRLSRRAHRSRRVRQRGAPDQYRAHAIPAARPHPGMGQRLPDDTSSWSGPTGAFSRARPIKSSLERNRRHPRRDQFRAADRRSEPAGQDPRPDAAERQPRHGDLAAHQGPCRPGHRDPGTARADLGLGLGALGDAVRHHRLRRADPRLCLPLAIDPRPRGRPHQRRRARPDRYRAQPRPLRPVGLGPRPRPDLLVAIDVHHARARQPQRPPHLRRGQRAGEVRRHRPVRDRRPADRRRRSITSTRPSACSTPTATGSGSGCAAN